MVDKLKVGDKVTDVSKNIEVTVVFAFRDGRLYVVDPGSGYEYTTFGSELRTFVERHPAAPGLTALIPDELHENMRVILVSPTNIWFLTVISVEKDSVRFSTRTGQTVSFWPETVGLKKASGGWRAKYLVELTSENLHKIAGLSI